MIRFGLVFPGQGSQKVGMGESIYDANEDVRKLFDSASSILGRDIAKVCFKGPQEELIKTVNTQPAIFLVSAALALALQQKGIDPIIVAGHSLGELTAYYVSGVLDLESVIKVIAKRSEAMSASYPADDSAMAAIIGLAVNKIREVVDRLNEYPVVVANYNSQEQTVISGTKEGVQEASSALKAKGGRVIPLKVSGAFHSPLMQNGAQILKEFLAEVTFNDAGIPIILNKSAQEETVASKLKENLPLQIISSVRWVDSVLKMNDQVDVIIECGSGKVLSGLIKKILPEKQVINVMDVESLLLL